jgi:hypothetical protein
VKDADPNLILLVHIARSAAWLAVLAAISAWLCVGEPDLLDAITWRVMGSTECPAAVGV